MKKLIIFLSTLLTSCVAEVGDLNDRSLIIVRARTSCISDNRASYVVKSYKVCISFIELFLRIIFAVAEF